MTDDQTITIQFPAGDDIENTAAAETRYQRIAREQIERRAARDARMKAAAKVIRRRHQRPVFGSQAWAETYRDDLGESPNF